MHISEGMFSYVEGLISKSGGSSDLCFSVIQVLCH